MDQRTIAIHASLLSCNRRTALAKCILEGNAIADHEVRGVDSLAVERIENACCERGIAIICVTDPGYPELLKVSPMPPACLFVQGDQKLICTPRALAVVGARNADMTSSEVAADFAHAAALNGITVMSGLALGVDGAAHTGALRSGLLGATAAVVANGLDIIYPSAHTQLAAQILSGGGAIISEYPPGTAPRTYHFLERNRLVAGLSFGVVVVQAGERSGALVTARLGIEAGRDVWVVPGSIRDPRFRGSNRLIQDGAHLVTSPFQIPGIEAPSVSSGNSGEDLTANEEKVMRVLSGKVDCHFEEILVVTQLSQGILRQVVNTLESRKLLESMPGNFLRVSHQGKLLVQLT